MPEAQFEAGVAMASVAGATAVAITNTSKDHWARKACEGLCGALVGVFCGPWFGDLARVEDSHARMAIGFCTGAAGLLILGLFLNAVKSKKIRSVIDAFVGRMTNTK